MTDQMSRRRLLRSLLLGGAGTGLMNEMSIANERLAASPAPAGQPQGTCVLLPQSIEGPYYFDPKQVRVDITEGRPGYPLRLVLKVIEYGPCTPVASARVDVWHADALGVYSGYSGQGDGRNVSSAGKTYLRGTQISDADGQVVFSSIYPGWYPGRTPHIHVKVFLDQKTLVTSQIYFPDALSARIYKANDPYVERPSPDTSNNTDYFYRSGVKEGGGIVLAVEESPQSVTASLVLSVVRS